MTYGSHLVMRGTLFAAALLAVFLYFVTSGMEIPAAVQAAAPASSPSSPALGAEAAKSQASQPLSAGCKVNPAFPPEIMQWCELISFYSDQNGLPVDLIAALIWQESGGNPLAYSKSGAVGLMQVMPSDGPAASFMCQNGPCFAHRPATESLQDPEFNLSYGTQLLAGLLSKSGDIREALKSYGPMDVGYGYADKVLSIYQRYGR